MYWGEVYANETEEKDFFYLLPKKSLHFFL